MWCATETQEVHSNKRKHTLFEHQHPHNHHLHCSIQQWVVPTLVVIIVYKLNIAAWQIRIMSISNVVHHILIWTNDLLTATILFVMTTNRPRTAGPQIVTCFSACNHRHFPRRQTHKKICWGIYPKKKFITCFVANFCKVYLHAFWLVSEIHQPGRIGGRFWSVISVCSFVNVSCVRSSWTSQFSFESSHCCSLAQFWIQTLDMLSRARHYLSLMLTQPGSRKHSNVIS